MNSNDVRTLIKALKKQQLDGMGGSRCVSLSERSEQVLFRCRRAEPPTRSLGFEPEWTLEPGDVPELAELAADRGKDADRSKPEPLVQRKGCGIGQADAGDDRMDILRLERGKEGLVERGPMPASTSVRMTVDADFDRRVVGRLRTPSAAAGVRNASALFVGSDEQPMRSGVGVIVEPGAALGGCERTGDRT